MGCVCGRSQGCCVMPLHRVVIILDDRHQVLGGSVVADYESPNEVIRPLSVGPFDTPQDVLQEALRGLPKQLALWDAGT